MTRGVRAAAATALVAALLPAGVALGAPGSDQAGTEVLAAAVEAARALPHAGEVTVVSFGDQGPQVSEIDVTRGDGAVRLRHATGWELGRVDEQGFMRSSGTLLLVGGVERIPSQLDRLWAKYDVEILRPVAIDTGPAVPLEITERRSGTRRGVLYVDRATGLIVRRETYGRGGAPLRVVAFTDLDVGPRDVAVPAGDGLEVADDFASHRLQELEASGFEIPAQLPRGYELLAAVEVADTTTATVHLLYGDGLYTLSVFQQSGRLAGTAVRGATELTTADGGTVWRWPGSEPRRVVWNGAGSTYTALTDAPVDELLDVLAGLPTDAAPSILDRLTRGIARVGRWLWPTESEPTESTDGSNP